MEPLSAFENSEEKQTDRLAYSLLGYTEAHNIDVTLAVSFSVLTGRVTF